MIVVSIGMQKSGSAYFYNLLNALEIEAKNADARQIKEKYCLEHLMKWHNNNIGKLSLFKLIKLWRISIKEGTFVVKSHRGPTFASKILSRLGMIKILYIYRDPRDVLLSAIDHGKKIIASGGNTTFAQMVDFDAALHHVTQWIRVWKKCNEMPEVMMIKYEELVETPVKVLVTVEQFLNIRVDDKNRDAILWRHSKENVNGEQTGLHLNRAISYRYKTEMSPEHKLKCLEKFGEYIEAMGYSLE